MRQKKIAPKRRTYNRLGLLISSSYLILTLVLKGFAYKTFVSSLEKQNITYEQIDIRPAPFGTILWTANIDAGSSYLIGNYSFFDSKQIHFESYAKRHNLLGELSNNDKIKRLIKITEGWYTISKNGDTLFFNDLRFGLMSLDPAEEKFAFSYELDQTGNELKVNETPKLKRDAKLLLTSLWQRIWGN